MITRPREDAQALAQALADRGVESIIEPLLEIVPVARAAGFAHVAVAGGTDAGRELRAAAGPGFFDGVG